MNNRQKIINCCKQLNLEIDELRYVRQTSYSFGEYCLWLKNGQYYETTEDDSINISVENLINDLVYDYQMTQYNHELLDDDDSIEFCDKLEQEYLLEIKNETNN